MTASTARRDRRRGRGRPVVFDQDARTRYLAALETGTTAGEAAALAGVSRNVPARHAKTDRAFADAVQVARELGRKARAERVPHGESRYNHHRCRCPVCRTEATERRTGRRATGGVHHIPPESTWTRTADPAA
ncbi:MAG TPA: hypothetical protein VFY14_20630 [Streptomyces sp.]|nr:hypothetical protein [Streptomyces sp.]